MHIGVYGSGYLATVISACSRRFRHAVCCCHSDSSRITEVAKGDILFTRRISEVIRRNVRSVASCIHRPEDLARKAQVIFLAEDSPQGLEDLWFAWPVRAGRVQVLSIVTPSCWHHHNWTALRHAPSRMKIMFLANGSLEGSSETDAARSSVFDGASAVGSKEHRLAYRMLECMPSELHWVVPTRTA